MRENRMSGLTSGGEETWVKVEPETPTIGESRRQQLITQPKI